MSAVPDTERPEQSALPGRALIPFIPPGKSAFAWPTIWQGLLAAAFGLALGVGVTSVLGARHTVAGWLGHGQSDPQAVMLHRLQDDVGHLQASLDALRSAADAAKPDEPLRGLRRSVEGLKQEIEQVRSTSTSTIAQIATKIDKAADHDPGAKLVDIAARLDRIEREAAAKSADGQGARLAELASRMDRIEKQVSAPMPTATIAPTPLRGAAIPGAPVKPAVPLAAKAETTSVPATSPTALPLKPATLDGWVLRDVYDGVALVEARGGGLREVGPGQYLPGAGEVRSIERRGRSWVVLTSRGVIDNTTF